MIEFHVSPAGLLVPGPSPEEVARAKAKAEYDEKVRALVREHLRALGAELIEFEMMMHVCMGPWDLDGVLAGVRDLYAKPCSLNVSELYQRIGRFLAAAAGHPDPSRARFPGEEKQ